jgi:peptidylprolyl isomerase
MRLAAALLLPFAALAQASGQTPVQTPAATPAKKPAVHHPAAAGASALPANIPRVPGIAKPLYALRYIDIKVGTGAPAPPTVLGSSQADSKVMFYTVRYTGWLAKDGKKFDSSYDHPGGEPFTFPFGVRRVIPGWDTGFDGMKIGGKRRLFIPWQLAYGTAGSPVRGVEPQAIPPKSDLIFDIELVDAADHPPAPLAPPAAPPVPKPTPAEPAKPTEPATPPTPPTTPTPPTH